MRMKLQTGNNGFSRWLGFALTVSISLLCGNVFAQYRPLVDEPLPTYDVRQFDTGPIPEPPPVDSGPKARRFVPLNKSVVGLKIDRNPVTQLPKFVRSPKQFLSEPMRGTASEIVKDFVTSRPELFQLSNSDFDRRDCVLESEASGASFAHVRYRQSLDGVDVLDSELRGNVTPGGQVINITGGFVPRARAARNTANPLRTADQALLAAAAEIGAPLVDPPAQISGPVGDEQAVVYGPATGLARGARARLVYFPLSRTETRLAWEVRVLRAGSVNQYRVIVDASTGNVLQRITTTKHAALQTITLNVFTSDSPSPFSPGSATPNGFQPAEIGRSLVTLISLSTNASPNGWINDGDNSTSGNNVIAGPDLDLDFNHDSIPSGSAFRVFDFPLDLTQEPSTYTDAATVNLFYWCNFAHDRMYDLGFDEASGNYQQSNFGRGGLGGDPILALCHAGADVGESDNAFFLPSPDGQSPFIAMFLWSGPTPERDGSLDAEIMLHEHTHGVSSRLVGVQGDISELQANGMGEGWSDFYALSLLSQDADDPDGVYAMGGYVTFDLFGQNYDDNYYFGIRRYPYTTDLNKNPLTLSDIDPTRIDLPANVPVNPIFGTVLPSPESDASEVHNQGEIWCTVLWECRAQMVKVYGFAGNEIMLKLVTDGMKLGPSNPTFLEARDAILQADVVNNQGANVCQLWEAFAKRGFGTSATVPNGNTTTGVVEAFDTPGECSVNVSETIVDDTTGGNANTFIEPGESINLFVVIQRPAGLTNTLTGITNSVLSTTTPGITITQANSSYPDIPAGEVRTNDTAYVFSVDTNVLCGSQINFDLQIQSAGGNQSVSFVLDVGVSITLLSLDFEGSNTNGVAISNTGNGLWHVSTARGTDGGHSASNSLYYGQGDTNGVRGGSYDTGTPNTGTVTLDPISLVGIQGRVFLTFNHFLQREPVSPSAYDVAKVEISRNGGISFVTLAGPYTTTTNGFQRETISLTPFINQEIIVRFSFNTVDQRQNDFEGWYVDDIVVRAFDCAQAGGAAEHVIAQGTSLGGTGVFTVTDGLTGSNLLSQTVLTGAAHSDFSAFASDTAGNGIESVVVAGRNDDVDGIDFEVRTGTTGDATASGSLSAGLSSPYAAISADVQGSSGQELVFVATPTGAGAPTLDVRDPITSDSVFSTDVLEPESFTSFTLVAADVDGNGQKEIAVIGERDDDGTLAIDIRSPSTNAAVASPRLKSMSGPFVAFASDLNGTGTEQIVLLGHSRGGSVLSVIDGLTGKTSSGKRVVKAAVTNFQAFAAQVVPGMTKQIVVLGSGPDGRLYLEVFSSKGRRFRSFDLATQLTAPLKAFAADINGDGRDEVVLSARRSNDGQPILIALDANTGGSFYITDLFESDTVSNIRIFAADVNGDGVADVVASATRDSDGHVLFETHVGSSGALFTGFDQGSDFAGPNAAFGANVGD